MRKLESYIARVEGYMTEFVLSNLECLLVAVVFCILSLMDHRGAAVVTGVLLHSWSRVGAPGGWEHEFLLECHHVLMLCEASLARGWLPTFGREGLRLLLLTVAWRAPKPLSTLRLLFAHQGVARYM